MEFDLKDELHNCISCMSGADAPIYNNSKQILSLYCVSVGVTFLFREENGLFMVYEIEYREEDPG